MAIAPDLLAKDPLAAGWAVAIPQGDPFAPSAYRIRSFGRDELIRRAESEDPEAFRARVKLAIGPNGVLGSYRAD